MRILIFLFLSAFFISNSLRAESSSQVTESTRRTEYSRSESGTQSNIEETETLKTKKKKNRRLFVTEDQEPRSDAGIFHAGFALGGNFYVEPKVSKTTREPTGDYYKDFGFQAGVYFDYDYSELEENIPLGLRGMVGYKYILNSVHVFAFDGAVRRMFRMAENTSFGLGIGGSAAVWYRVGSDTADEEVLFLPSFLITAGFEFNPFMVDIKWLINRFGQDSTITGVELSVGVRI